MSNQLGSVKMMTDYDMSRCTSFVKLSDHFRKLALLCAIHRCTVDIHRDTTSRSVRTNYDIRFEGPRRIF